MLFNFYVRDTDFDYDTLEVIIKSCAQLRPENEVMPGHDWGWAIKSPTLEGMTLGRWASLRTWL